MGKHSQHRNHPGRQGRHSRDDRDRAVDPEDKQLVEPDRDAEDPITPEERQTPMEVHTDRDPEDDLHLAASDPQDDATQC